MCNKVNNRAITKLIAVVAAGSLLATPALAENARQLVDINGERAGDAEVMLQQRGFTHTSTNKNSRGAVHSYWWNGRDDNCVNVEVLNGRVNSIVDVSDQDCGHHKGGAVAGAVAGAAILGALLSHKSNHHEDRQHLADQKAEADYERGYADGLHNAAYHNYDRSDAYSNGYTAGVDQRQANLSHHNNRGGYTKHVSLSGIEGKGDEWAVAEMGSRGFRKVDGYRSSGQVTGIFYHYDTRQCVMMVSEDYQVISVSELRSHPKCR